MKSIQDQEEPKLPAIKITRFFKALDHHPALIPWMVMLCLSSGISIYMNIHGMKCILPSIPRFAMTVGLLIELLKLGSIYTFHKHNPTANLRFRLIILAAMMVFSAVSLIDAFKFLDANHVKAAASFTDLERNLSDIREQEDEMIAAIKDIEANLSELPKNQVTKRIRLKKEDGYEELKASRWALAEKRRVIEKQREEALNDSAGIYSIAHIIGMDDKLFSWLFLSVICFGIELASIVTLMAILKFWDGNCQNSQAVDSAENASQNMPKTSVSADSAKIPAATQKTKKAQKAENATTSENKVDRDKNGISQNSQNSEQHRYEQLLGLCRENEWDEEDVLEHSGKSKKDTIVRWMTGKKTIPEKELRNLQKKADKLQLRVNRSLSLISGKNTSGKKNVPPSESGEKNLPNPSAILNYKSSKMAS